MITNNYIHKVAVEYEDAVGIWLGYVKCVRIVHNEVSNLSYTGISLGWGWGTFSYAYNNIISNNYIHDVMQILDDGGGIYTLSAQPNSVIKDNYIDGLYGSAYHTPLHIGIYLDAGTRYFQVYHNVIVNSLSWSHVQMSDPPSEYNVLEENYIDTTNTFCCGPNNIVCGNHLFSLQDAPTEVLIIKAKSGLQPPYEDIKNQ